MKFYEKVKVRSVEGGYRLKFCDDPFNDIFIAEWELSGNKPLLSVLMAKKNYYGDVDDGIEFHGGSKFSNHLKRVYHNKYRNIIRCIQVLSGQHENATAQIEFRNSLMRNI